MPAETRNESLARQFFETLSTGDLEALREYLDTAYILEQLS
jgi:hypothetical protein